MARVGPLQAFALLAGILFLLALAASRGRMRSLRRAAIAALGVATAILGLEVLMILGWLVTLWPSTDATAADLGASRQLSLWPVGWHAQIVVGFMLLIVELLVAAAALERWTRRHRTEIPALELSRE